MALLGVIVSLAIFLLISGADFQLISQHNVIGTWKRSVVLPCSYTPVDSYQHGVTWLFKGKRMMERDDTGDHTFLTQFRDRLSLPPNRKGVDVSLTIANIQTDDRGPYTCKVALRRNGTSDLINLETVTELAVEKVAVTKPVIQPEGPFLEVSEGATLNLTCSADGSPPIAYRWYKRVMSGGNKVIQAQSVSFMIKKAQNSDSGIYFCEVENRLPDKRVQQSEELQLSVTGRTFSPKTTPEIKKGSTEGMGTTERSSTTVKHEAHHTRAPTSTKDQPQAPERTLYLVIVIVLLSLALLCTLAAILVIWSRRKKVTDGFYQITTMNELTAQANQDSSADICHVNSFQSNGCHSNGMAVRKQNAYQLATPNAPPPESDYEAVAFCNESEYEELLIEKDNVFQ